MSCTNNPSTSPHTDLSDRSSKTTMVPGIWVLPGRSGIHLRRSTGCDVPVRRSYHRDGTAGEHPMIRLSSCSDGTALFQ